MAGRQEEPTSQWVGAQETPVSQSNRIARAGHAKDDGKVGHPMAKSVNTRRPPHGQRQLSVRKVTNK